MNLSVSRVEQHESLLFHLIVHHNTNKYCQDTRERSLCTLIASVISIRKDSKVVHDLDFSKVWSISVLADDMESVQ